ncbi:hypothetical protein RB601_000097 [Gaeumannomyces tritici]
MDSSSQQNLGPRLSNNNFITNGFSRQVSCILLRGITASSTHRSNNQASSAFIVDDHLRAIGNLTPFALLRILAATSDLLSSSATATMDARRTNNLRAMSAELQSTASPQGQSPARQLSIQTNVAGTMGRGGSPGRGNSPGRVAGSPSSSRNSSSSDGGAWEASTSTTIYVNDILYSTKEIRGMADEIDLAHHSGEFPTTRYLNHNAQATVDDYRRLMELREARESNDNARASLLLVGLTRDIRERDDELDERLERQRVVNRVEACLRTAQEEERLFRVMQTALLQDNNRNDLASIVAQTAAQTAQTGQDLREFQNAIVNTVAHYSLHDSEVMDLKLALFKREVQVAIDALHTDLHTALPGLIQQGMEQSLRQSKKNRRIFSLFRSNKSQQEGNAEPKGLSRLFRKMTKKLGGLGKDENVVATAQPPLSPMNSVPMIFLDEPSVVRAPLRLI